MNKNKPGLWKENDKTIFFVLSSLFLFISNYILLNHFYRWHIEIIDSDWFVFFGIFGVLFLILFFIASFKIQQQNRGGEIDADSSC